MVKRRMMLNIINKLKEISGTKDKIAYIKGEVPISSKVSTLKPHFKSISKDFISSKQTAKFIAFREKFTLELTLKSKSIFIYSYFLFNIAKYKIFLPLQSL